MVDDDRTVGIDIDQRTGLIEVRRVERDTEFHRRQCNATLDDRARVVLGAQGGATRAIVTAALQLGHDVVQDVVFDWLTVMRFVAVSEAVEVDSAHIKRIAAECVSDFVHDLLDQEHALRPAKAAERGVRHLVRLAQKVADAHMLKVVRIVDVAHCARIDRAREIGRIPAVGCQHEVSAENAPTLVVADVVLKLERMPLASDDHVVIAVKPQLHRDTELRRRNRHQRREQRGL